MTTKTVTTRELSELGAAMENLDELLKRQKARHAEIFRGEVLGCLSDSRRELKRFIAGAASLSDLLKAEDLAQLQHTAEKLRALEAELGGPFCTCLARCTCDGH